MGKKYLRKSTAVILFFLLPAVKVYSQQGFITILHTNDMHGHYLPLKNNRGGMEALSSYIKKEKNDHTILLDAGDIQTGTLISRLKYKGIRGGGFIAMMNRLGYDAMVPGNHEFDNGISDLESLINMAEFDIISANLYENVKGREKLFCRYPYKILKRNNIKIGVIGLTTKNLTNLVSKKCLENIRVKDVVSTAKYWIDKIDPETDLIILLTHQGLRQDSILASSVSNADIIIGGHSHTFSKKILKVNDVLIVQAGCNCLCAGKLNLEVESDRVINSKYNLVWLYNTGDNPDTVISGLTSFFRNKINDEYGEKIGRAKIDLTRSRYTPSSAGNFVTDIMRQTAKTDFAVINSGAIRKNLSSGNITEKDIFEMLPFFDHLVRFKCTGRQLQRLIKKNGYAQFRKSSILQVSGLEYTVRICKNRTTIITAKTGRMKIIDDEEYTGVTVDYISDGKSFQYLGFNPGYTETMDVFLTDAVIRFIRKNPVIVHKGERKIRIVE